MTEQTESTDDDRRALVSLLVERAGIPASTEELDVLVAGAPAVEAAVRRLYAVEMEHETEPAVVLTHPLAHS